MNQLLVPLMSFSTGSFANNLSLAAIMPARSGDKLPRPFVIDAINCAALPGGKISQSSWTVPMKLSRVASLGNTPDTPVFSCIRFNKKETRHESGGATIQYLGDLKLDQSGINARAVQ